MLLRQEQSRTGEMDKAGEKGDACVGLVSEELRGMDLDTKSKAWTREVFLHLWGICRWQEDKGAPLNCIFHDYEV